MGSVVITGASGALGRRVVTRLADAGTWSVVAIDQRPFPSGVAKPRHFTAHRVNLATAPLDRLMAGAEVVVHLATTGSDGDGVVEADERLVSRVAAAASSTGARRMIVLSSAVVYGAWSENPVPLTETAPLRPNPPFLYAQQKARVEKTAQEWRNSTEHHDRRLAVLRPVTTLGHPDSRAWLAKAVEPTLAERVTLTLPAIQYVHVDDLADAIVHALELELDGEFNVSSSDWLTSEARHALLGPNIGFPIPDRVATVLRSIFDRIGTRRPAGAADYVLYPWVVASDKLMATGWAPRSSSAEAFVAAKRPMVMSGLYARRRQEMNLAGVSLLGLSIGGSSLALFRWLRLRATR